MTVNRILHRLRADRCGAVAMEFALLAPAVIAMMLGILMLGLYMQAYNSVRSIVYDTERYTVVEYQKDNKMQAPQIEQVAIAIGSRAPYSLGAGTLDAHAVSSASGMTGAQRFDLTVSYTPPAISGIFKVHPPTVSETSAIIVPD